MDVAHFRQVGQVSVTTRAKNKTLLTVQLPPGSYAIIVKFTVAVEFGADSDHRPRISKFGLSFAGVVDESWCDLKQGELDTVVLTVAGSHNFAAVLKGQAKPGAKARFYCIQTSDDLEVKQIAFTAIPVDAVSTGDE